MRVSGEWVVDEWLPLPTATLLLLSLFYGRGAAYFFCPPVFCIFSHAEFRVILEVVQF